MSFRPSTALLLGLLAAVPPCAVAADAAGPASPAPTQPAGHRRMVEQLRVISEQARSDNPFLGRKPIDELESQLAELPPDRPDIRAWYLHKELGRHQLRLGQIELGLRHHRAAYDQMNRLASEIPVEEAYEALFQLGVAYMRYGEMKNCVARHTSESCILPIRGSGVHVDQEGATRAVEMFSAVLEHAPPGSYDATRARWLLNIAYMTLGRYPDGVPEAWRIPPSVFASDETIPRFTDIAPRLGLNVMDLSGGAAIEDLDGDGDLDLITSTLDTSGPLSLFRNDGGGKFTERAGAAGLDGLFGGLNLTTADYDNDGDVDVFVLRGAWFGKHGKHPNSLLRNDGKGNFIDVTHEAGLGLVDYPTQAGAWADYDNDGDLDLYVGNESSDELHAPGQLFRNDGKGRFVDVAAAAGVVNLRFAKGVAWGDYDGDRWPDLYVSNMGQPNRLYRNKADGTFEDLAEKLGVTGPLASFPTWFWDYDNDGVLDLFVGAYGTPQRPDVADVAASYLGQRHRAELPHLYHGDGKGGFTEVGRQLGLTIASLAMGANFGDFDYDGFPDFYLGTGYPYYEGLMPNVMYRNQGGRQFADVTTSGGFGHLQKGHAVVFGDLDEDGDQDVFEQIGGAYPGDSFGNVLFDNPGFGNHWVKLSLVGERSNRFGVGASIRLTVPDGETSRTIHRQVGTGGSFGANPLRQEIGLGRTSEITRLEVYWPTSDTTQVFEHLALDRWIRITEGQEALEFVESGPRPAPVAR